jgi:hypothetical protein
MFDFAEKPAVHPSSNTAVSETRRLASQIDIVPGIG